MPVKPKPRKAATTTSKRRVPATLSTKPDDDLDDVRSALKDWNLAAPLIEKYESTVSTLRKGEVVGSTFDPLPARQDILDMAERIIRAGRAVLARGEPIDKHVKSALAAAGRVFNALESDFLAAPAPEDLAALEEVRVALVVAHNPGPSQDGYLAPDNSFIVAHGGQVIQLKGPLTRSLVARLHAEWKAAGCRDGASVTVETLKELAGGSRERFRMDRILGRQPSLRAIIRKPDGTMDAWALYLHAPQ